MSPIAIVVVVLLVLLCVGSFPRWPHSKNYGYAPSGIAGTLLVVLLVLLLLGRM